MNKIALSTLLAGLLAARAAHATNGMRMTGFGPVQNSMGEMSDNESGAISWNLDWSDQLVLKAGVEVTALPELKLRAGYNYGKMPLNADRAFENIAFPAVSEHHIMGGIGLSLSSRVGVNLGVMIAPSATLTGANAAPPPAMSGTGQGITSYETSMSQWTVDGGLAYRY